jgi:polyvinyl alcohol dehydrogenase (cytochrome)
MIKLLFQPYKKLLFIVGIILFSQTSFSQKPSGETLYNTRCAVCHNGSMKEAPRFEALSLLPKPAIIKALQSGIMKVQGASLTAKEHKLLADFISKIDVEKSPVNQGVCVETGKVNLQTRVSSWGMGLTNKRFMNDKGINPENISKLSLKWVFAFPNATRARSQPTVAGNTLFTSDQNGLIYALDRRTGCVRWTYQAESEIRSAIVIGTDKKGNANRLYFGDFKANVYAFDIQNKKLLWKKRIDDHEVATITGTLSLYNGRLYIPVSSTEIVSAMNPKYTCCSFRGSVVALNAEDGGQFWKTYTCEEPKPNGTSTVGTPKLGPSGVPVWSSPTIDVKRGLLYVGTGENYSRPASSMSDAIIAMSLENGAIKWARQTVISDAWNGACTQPNSPNCPENTGPDFDFGAPPILLEGKQDLLVAGQKSGMVYALNPDDGKVVWEQRVGRGGVMGGIHWGMASDGKRLYVPINDQYAWAADSAKKALSGLHALSIADGKILWSVIERNRCEPNTKYVCGAGLSAAITVIPDIVFGGALDGILKAYSTTDGKTLWEFNTNQDFKAVNGVKANGGAIDSSGSVVVDNQLFINSGYAKFGEKSGNVLICFEAN